ncbi:hypothetical protein CPB84DRAFT_1680642, partial [Gymnopilus junonius]
ENSAGIGSYVATPTVGCPKDKVVLLYYVALNYNITSSTMLLLADAFAKNGFKTVIPDFLNGDTVPPSGLTYAPDFDLGKWFKNHSQEQTRPPLDKVINPLTRLSSAASYATPSFACI